MTRRRVNDICLGFCIGIWASVAIWVLIAVVVLG